MAGLMPAGKQQYFDNNGDPLDGGKLYTFEANSVNTPKSTFADQAGTTPNTNPIILDARGEATVFWEGAYKVRLEDSLGNLIWTQDELYPVGYDAELLRGQLANTNDVTENDALIGVKQEDSGAVAQTLHIWIKAARRRLTDFGFLWDGQLTSAPTNNAAFALAMAALRDRRGGILEAGGVGSAYFSTDLVALLNGTTMRFFAFEFEGMEACRLLSTNGSKLKIYADTPPARANAFVDLVLEGFEITNTSGSKTGDGGIDIYSMQRSRISGVRGTGWNYGLRLRSSWNNTIDQRCQFDNNNVGIKVPRQGSGVDLNEGFNSTDIRGISCANNVKAGLSLANGNVLTIQNLLAESNPVGVYLIEAVKKATIEDVYFELGSTTKTELNRAGALQGYVVYTGKDEDGNVGDTAKPNKDLDLRHLMRDDGNGAVFLDNVDGVRLPNDESGRGYTTFGTSVRNITSNGISGDNSRSSPMVQGKGRPVARNILRDFNQNWIPNGNFSLPGLPYHVLTGAGVTSAQSSAQSMDGYTVRTLDITLPNGTTSASIRFDITVPAGSDFATLNNLIYSSVHAVAGSSDFASVTLEILDQGAAIATVTKSSGLSAAWFVLSCEGSINANVAVVTSLSIRISLTRTTGVGAAVFSVDELVCGDVNRAQVGVFNSMDFDVGLSGVATTTVGSGAWFYADVTTAFADPAYFDVELTARYDGAQTDTIVQYQKTGGNNLRIWSNKNGAQVFYRVVPRVMVLP